MNPSTAIQLLVVTPDDSLPDRFEKPFAAGNVHLSRASTLARMERCLHCQCPDGILLDGAAFGKHLEAVATHGKAESVPVVVLVENVDVDRLSAAYAAGAMAVLPRKTTPEVLLRQIRVVTQPARDDDYRAELIRHRTMLEEVEQIAHTGGWEWDLESDRWKVSDEWANIHGVSRKAFGREELMGLLHVDNLSAVGAALEQVRMGEAEQFNADYRLASELNGDVRHMRSVGKIVRDESGKPVRMYGIALDVTERKKLEKERLVMEAQLRKSQKLESLGTLAGGVAHEINNPLAVITGYADLVLMRQDVDPATLEQVHSIRTQADRVALIVKNLLSFSRYDEQSGQEFHEVRPIVEETLSLIQTVMKHDAIRVDLEIPATLPRIRCHRQQIQQVLMNLMTNARDALNEKYPGPCEEKHILISASTFCREIRPTDPPDTALNWLALTVEDKGPGIPEDVRQRLFDPFYTTKSCDKGTGLGLWICHEIIGKHKGHLDVDSQPGEWTRFHINLPLVKARAREATPRPRLAPIPQLSIVH